MASFLSNESVGGYLSQMSLVLNGVSRRAHTEPVCVAVMVGLTAMQSVQLLGDVDLRKSRPKGRLPYSLRLKVNLRSMDFVGWLDGRALPITNNACWGWTCQLSLKSEWAKYSYVFLACARNS